MRLTCYVRVVASNAERSSLLVCMMSLPFASRGHSDLREIPVEFNAITIRVAEVECLADTVIGCAVEPNFRSDKTIKGAGEFGSCRVENCEVKQARCARGWRLTAKALPGVDADVMMIAASRKKRGRVADALRYFEAEDIVIEGQRAVEVRYAQMYMSDARAWVNWLIHVVFDESGLGEGAAVGRRDIFGACVECDFPFTVNFLPDGDGAA
jgi:hypothetical protein